MINRIYRLMDAKRVEMVQREVNLEPGLILTKPDYMAVCAADKRYYFGRRRYEILRRKLPMALIHEATATVLYDPSGELNRGAKVVLVPLIEETKSSVMKGNYNPDNAFLSSGYDGFMRDFVSLPKAEIIPIPNDYSEIYVFSEIVSVVLNALEAFERASCTPKDIFGVWGDGSMGYVTGLVLKCRYPESKVYIFGKNLRKLQHFSFADETISIDENLCGLRINHCFECVGGSGSERAIAQIIESIAPQGCVNLLGVSEDTVAIDTRTVLDKGLSIIGNNRSTAADMCEAVTLIHENTMCRKYLQMLISEIIDVRNENDIAHVFEQSSLNDFKTVIKWAI
jgi:ribitol-5-phosphate 2-dehydrogenase